MKLKRFRNKFISMLLTLGGCEPQLKGHIRGNLNLRNDNAFDTVPYRSLCRGYGG